MRRSDGRVCPPARDGPEDGARRGPLWAAAAVVVVSVLLVSVSAAVVGASDRTRPDDPMFEDQWALENTGQLVNWKQGSPGADIDATRAWNLTTGSDSVVVAILDADLDYEAEDLAANAWVNPGGVNGCPAGSHGYHVPTGACEPDATAGHGTLMGWIIGAVANNGQGMSGVNWTTSLMGVTVRSERTDATFVESVDWVIGARNAGVNVRVMNASWGWLSDSPEVRDAIARAGEHGILLVAAAGNNGDDRDVDPVYPCNFDLSNVICVAASDQDDELAPGSSYGASTVDLAAPGHNICSSPYSGCSGLTSTSDATAFVSGAAALVWAYDPGLSAGQVRRAILGGVDRLDSLEGKVATGGRLNVYRAITSTDPVSPSPSGSESESPSPTPSESESESESRSGSDSGSPSPSWSETGSESPSSYESPPSRSDPDDSPHPGSDPSPTGEANPSPTEANSSGTAGAEDAGTADDTQLGAAGSHPASTTDGASDAPESAAGAADSRASAARQPDADGWAWVIVVGGLAAGTVIGSRRMN